MCNRARLHIARKQINIFPILKQEYRNCRKCFEEHIQHVRGHPNIAEISPQLTQMLENRQLHLLEISSILLAKNQDFLICLYLVSHSILSYLEVPTFIIEFVCPIMIYGRYSDYSCERFVLNLVSLITQLRI